MRLTIKKDCRDNSFDVIFDVGAQTYAFNTTKTDCAHAIEFYIPNDQFKELAILFLKGRGMNNEIEEEVAAI